MRLRAFFASLVLTTLLGLLPSCVTIAPYQRELLARPSMNPDEFESSEGGFQAHVFQSREGAAGGLGTTGGGCGCN